MGTRGPYGLLKKGPRVSRRERRRRRERGERETQWYGWYLRPRPYSKKRPTRRVKGKERLLSFFVFVGLFLRVGFPFGPESSGPIVEVSCVDEKHRARPLERERERGRGERSPGRR
jgi:hypothetical protein